MTNTRRTILLTLLALLSIFGKGQTPLVDSLEKSIYRAAGEDQKLAAIIALCNEYKSLHRDTLDLYAYLAHDLAQKSANSRLKDQAELVLAYDYLRWGWRDSVLATVNPLIKESKLKDPADRDLYFKASRLKAMTYATHGDYKESLAILYQIVSLAETHKDNLTLAENFNSLASVALARGLPAEAFTWLTRAMSLAASDPAIDAAIYVNMGEACHQSGKTDSANYYIGKGISLFRQTGILSNLALALQRQSNILIDAHQLDQAEAALKEMVDIRKQLGDGDMIQDENLSLINFYIQTGQVEKAIKFCTTLLKSGDLRTADPASGGTTYANSINIRLGYFEALAKCYKLTGQTDLYRQTLEEIIVAKDSSYQFNSARAIAELQTKYEVQRKENTIIQQQLDITRKNNRFNILIGIAFFIAVISILLFTGYRKREKIRLTAMLEKKKNEAEENERKRIAADLHDNLGAHAASIVSNLDLIELSTAGLSTSTAMQELRNNSLAIVSQLNDTIWALKKDALSLTTLSDRIKIFIQRIQYSYPSVNIGVNEEIEDDVMLSPSHALHLFRIVQEAINNALRHSKAQEIVVGISSREHQWEISITDNGTGIQPQTHTGNGLANMRERADKSGWKIFWLRREPTGTIVQIRS
ncbi:MAG: hypothetical protein JST68_19575 [Bacteroidetes bacterium]|nr:hypothetical protein [Bacteroidota bacterium]